MTSLIRTARFTGAAYLALAVFGLTGFLVIRRRLSVEGDSAATLANLVEHSSLAHLGIALELLVVIAQAAAAVGFYALFRRDRPVAAYGVATFGMANAITILVSVALLVVASGVAVDPATAPAGDAAATIALLFAVADALWATGAIFFGLWLIPMGWFVISTLRMPRALGWVLVVGGVGYVLSALLGAAAPTVSQAVVDMLTVPATVGELWMLTYLLVVGIRPAIEAPSLTPLGPTATPAAASATRALVEPLGSD